MIKHSLMRVKGRPYVIALKPRSLVWLNSGYGQTGAGGADSRAKRILLVSLFDPAKEPRA